MQHGRPAIKLYPTVCMCAPASTCVELFSRTGDCASADRAQFSRARAARLRENYDREIAMREIRLYIAPYVRIFELTVLSQRSVIRRRLSFVHARARYVPLRFYLSLYLHFNASGDKSKYPY